jgi:riboflavin kinase/FMN adenylyltransferase
VVQVIREREPPDLPAGAAVAIGAFDGVHLGHQAVLAATSRRAAEQGGLALAYVRESPPADASMLTTLEQRLELFAAHGIVRCVVVGDEGAWPPAVPPATVVQVPPVSLPGAHEPISSSAIRGALAIGELDRATAMLGRPYEVWGVVEHGDHRGRTIGFPTANLALPERLQLPADGVYSGWYETQDGAVHLAAINLGRRPTFYDEGTRLLEAYLLDFHGDLYGEHARVRFGVRLRDELKFDSVDELVTQMHADVAAVERLAPAGPSTDTTGSAD